MPFSAQIVESFVMGLADGPTEVHKVTVARQVLREYKPTAGLFPTAHIPAQRERAIQKYAQLLELEVGNL
jgi:acyl-CoA dehydrogenase